MVITFSRPPSDILFLLHVYQLYRGVLVVVQQARPPSPGNPPSARAYGSISALHSLYIGIADGTPIARMHAHRYLRDVNRPRPGASQQRLGTRPRHVGATCLVPRQVSSATCLPRMHARCQVSGAKCHVSTTHAHACACVHKRRHIPLIAPSVLCRVHGSRGPPTGTYKHP